MHGTNVKIIRQMQFRPYWANCPGCPGGKCVVADNPIVNATVQACAEELDTDMNVRICGYTEAWYRVVRNAYVCKHWFIFYY